MPDRITLMAAGELRTALTALHAGDLPTAAGALASIDPDSWAAIQRRLADLGGDLAQLLTTAKEH